MWSKLESARGVLFGEKRPPESGDGIRILYFEAPDAVGAQAEPSAERFRLAPGATDIVADATAFEGGFRRRVEEVRERAGGVHVICHPRPTHETHELATVGRAEQVLISDWDGDGSLVVAAAGGFPASAPVALTVGVCDAEARPVGGQRDGSTAPALCVPEAACATRAGAAYIVADLAALWSERLRAAGHPAGACVVRAALLSGSYPSASPGTRVTSASALTDGAPFAVAYEQVRAGRTLVFRVEPAGAGRLCVAAVPRYGRHPAQWAAEPARVTLRAAGAEHRGDGWAVIDIEDTRSPVLVELEVEGAVTDVAVVATGAAACTAERARLPAQPRRKPEVIVGISASHDASACLLVDGRLECAVQLERLTRVKRDGRAFLHSREAVDYCLAALNLTERDVDLFAFNIQNLVPEHVGLSHPLADASFDLFDPLDERVVFVSHHLAHAFAAFFASPFENSAVFVADGSGGSVIEDDDLLLKGPGFRDYLNRRLPTPRPPYHVQSAYEFGPDGFRLVKREVARSFHPMCGSSSLGETYASVSQYVFGEWQEGGKLMGLAPYGNAEEMGETLLTRDDDGNLQFGSTWKERHRQVNKRLPPLEYRHLAARVQRDLEEALVERVRLLVESTGRRDVAYAGGVALNSVANQRLLCEAGVERLYVLPASHDAGISIGAAAAAHFLSTGRTKGTPVTHDFHGRAYGERDIERALAELRGFVGVRPYDVRAAAERLAANQTLGWFEGGAEFGPRALGHRSIMAAPFERAMWLHLNQRVKYREEFRPYAPVVPREVAGQFFEMGPDPDSPFMLRVVKVRPEYRDRLGAVTHVDGSARVQTVDRERTPRWHELLHAFGALTGIPVLVNTSMNVRGEPIVETPMQALELLLSTYLDALVLEDKVVEPVVADGFEELLLARAPKVEVEAGTRGAAPFYRLVCRARGSFSVPLPMSVFLLLSHADGRTRVGELLDRFTGGADERARAEALLRQLFADRLLLLRSPRGESSRNVD